MLLGSQVPSLNCQEVRFCPQIMKINYQLGMLLALRAHLHLLVLPVGEAQGLDLADVGDVAVDPGARQTDEHPQRAGAPPWICREEDGEDKWRFGGYEGTERKMD